MGWWVLSRRGTTCQQQAVPRLILHMEVWLKDIPNYGISKKIEQMFHVRAMMFLEHLPILQCLSLRSCINPWLRLWNKPCFVWKQWRCLVWALWKLSPQNQLYTVTYYRSYVYCVLLLCACRFCCCAGRTLSSSNRGKAVDDEDEDEDEDEEDEREKILLSGRRR